MILLSNLIKNSRYVPVDNKRKINIISRPLAKPVEEVESNELSDEENTILRHAEQRAQEIMKDAEQFAATQLKRAAEEAEALKRQAEQDIQAWWEDKRNSDQQLIDEVKQQGFEQGHLEGVERATAEVNESYASMIEEATSLLERAHQHKHRIIQEAEPFLLELSTEIARKIIRKQLTESPEWMIELIKNALARQREQGVITLCVSPEHYAYVEGYKEELALILDSQAELQILPDGKVKDHGCIIRSAMGSIDATIDTQLTEVKNALYSLTMQDEGGRSDS